MKKLLNKSAGLLYIIQIILFLISIFFAYGIYQDTNTIDEKFVKKHRDLAKSINNLDKQIKKEYLKSDSLYKPNLLYLNENVIDIKEKTANFQIEKEKEFEVLYLERMKYWIYFIALIATIFVILGLEWKISNKVDERVDEVIANKIEERKELIGQIVNEKDWEFRLMAKANIMVVNPNKTGDAKNLNPVLKFFSDKGAKIEYITDRFDNPDGIKQAVNKKFNNDRFNIVLLENSDGNWNLFNKKNNINATKIASYIPDKAMLLYFGPGSAGFFPNKPDNFFPVFNENYENFTQKIKELQEKKEGLNDKGKEELANLSQEINKIKKTLKGKANKIIDTISFVNTPSKLYPNLIDALKYLDIINPEIDA